MILYTLRRRGTRVYPVDMIAISVPCAQNEGDADNLREIKYYPKHGFPIKHYPYYNQPNYLPPLVFVQFDTPREGALIQVRLLFQHTGRACAKRTRDVRNLAECTHIAQSNSAFQLCR